MNTFEMPMPTTPEELGTLSQEELLKMAANKAAIGEKIDSALIEAIANTLTPEDIRDLDEYVQATGIELPEGYDYDKKKPYGKINPATRDFLTKIRIRNEVKLMQ